MYLYILPSIVFIISFSDYIREKKLKDNILIGVLLTLVLVSTFRSSSLDIFYGYDTNQYINFYNEVSLEKDTFEIGYTILNLMIKIFTDNYRYVFFIMSLLTMYFLYKYVYYYTENRFIAILAYISIFYFIRDLSQMRAALSYAICAYSTIYILENRPKRFLLYVALATSIHFSSILTLILYPIYKLRLSKIYLYIILITAIILFKVDLMNIISDLFGMLGENKYTTSFINYTLDTNARGLDSKVLLYIAITICGIYIKDFKSIKSDRYDINIYMVVLGIFIAGLFNGSEIISVRLSELFLTSMIVIFSRFKDVIEDKNLEVVFHILTGLFLIAYNMFFIYSLSKYGI